jgi:L-rhamnose mutarotase
MQGTGRSTQSGAQGGDVMKIYGRMIDLRDDQEKIDAYVRYHAEVWPEVLEGLRKDGVTDMKIFLRGRRMFMYMTATEGYVPGGRTDGHTPHPRVLEWDRLMRTLQQPSAEASGAEWWADMDLVFDLHWPQHLPELAQDAH